MAIRQIDSMFCNRQQLFDWSVENDRLMLLCVPYYSLLPLRSSGKISETAIALCFPIARCNLGIPTRVSICTAEMMQHGANQTLCRLDMARSRR